MSTKSRTQAAKRTRDIRKERLFWVGRVGLFVLSFVITTVVLVVEHREALIQHEFVIGEPAPRTLFAPVELTYENESATELIREQKSSAILPVYRVNSGMMEQALAQVDQLIQSVLKVKSESTETVIPELPELPFEVSNSSLKYLIEEADLSHYRDVFQKTIVLLFDQGILDREEKGELLKTGIKEIRVISGDGKREEKVRVEVLAELDQVRAHFWDYFSEDIKKDRKLKGVLEESLRPFLGSSLQFDANETNVRRKRVAKEVKPIEEKIQKNELMIQRGMLVTGSVKEKIEEIQQKVKKYAVFNRFTSVGFFVFLAYLFCFLYLFFFDRKSLNSYRALLLIHSVFLLTTALCKLFAVWPGSSLYLMPAALASLLLVLLVGARLGILGAFVMAILIAPLARFAPEVIVASLVSSIAGTFSSVKVRKRIQFLKVGAAVGLSYMVVLFAFQIFQEYPVGESFQNSLSGIVNGLLIATPLCFFLFFPLLESAFDFTTDITLLELSDLNHPLLKRMVIEAPGTYHHSLAVSALAESACEAIGANALLARVGCYFHDIGKISRAEFFSENQKDRPNRHEKLSPTMSSLIIMNHIKDGLELGKKHKIRAPILNFIPEHHGSGVIYYFYKKALDAAKPGEKVNADDFRYPGPKPQRRETAVALLADSVEAASRSLVDSSQESVRQLVRKVVNDKFIDGQLDECDLTLRDLHGIQESFACNLMAIYHSRVAYPIAPDSPNKPDLFEDGQFDKYRFDSPDLDSPSE